MVPFVTDPNGHVLDLPKIRGPVNVAVSGTSAQSAALNAATSIVRLSSTTNCYVLAGANPTATSSHTLVLAGVPRYMEVTGGHKIAAIRVSADGVLGIEEIL